MRRWVVPVPEEDWAGGARKNPPESLGQFGESSIEAERPLQKLVIPLERGRGDPGLDGAGGEQRVGLLVSKGRIWCLCWRVCW